MATSYDSTVNTDTSAIRPPTFSDEIKSINYYTLSGISILKPTNGIYIKEVLYKNGNKQHKKETFFL